MPLRLPPARRWLKVRFAHLALGFLIVGVLVLIVAVRKSAYSSGSASGAVQGKAFNVSSVASGDAGSSQIGLVLTEVPSVTCSTDFSEYPTSSRSLVILVPQKTGTWYVPRASVDSGAAGSLILVDSNGRQVKVRALKGQVVIDEFSPASSSLAGHVKGSFSLDFRNGDHLEGVFDTPYCLAIGL